MIAAIGTGLTLFVGLPMAIERVQAQNSANAVALQNHIDWANKQVDRRDQQLREVVEDGRKRDDQMLSLLSAIDGCLRNRTCTK